MSCKTLKGRPKLIEKLLSDFCSTIKRHKLRLHSLTRQSWMGNQMNANLIAIDFLSTSHFESKGLDCAAYICGRLKSQRRKYRSILPYLPHFKAHEHFKC